MTWVAGSSAAVAKATAPMKQRPDKNVFNLFITKANADFVPKQVGKKKRRKQKIWVGQFIFLLFITVFPIAILATIVGTIGGGLFKKMDAKINEKIDGKKKRRYPRRER